MTRLTYEILLALSDADRHGYGIIKEIEAGGGSPPSTGAMYLALQRMEGTGLIEVAPERPAESDGRRKYYRITPGGREAVEAETMRLASLLATARAKQVVR